MIKESMASKLNNRSSGKAKLLRWLLRFLILTLIGGGIVFWAKFRPKKVITVKIAKLERGTIYDLVNSESAGDVLTREMATIRSQVSGQVINVSKKIKDRVQKGELIATLDANDILSQIHQAETAIQSAAAQVAQAKARANTLAAQLELAQNLQKRGAGTSQAVKDAQNNWLEASASQRVAAAQLNQSRAAKQVLEVSLSRTKFYAPFDGSITELPIKQGDSVSPGNMIFQMMNEEHIYVEVNIAEADAGKVKEGQKVTLVLDALPGISISGSISQVDPALKKDAKGARLLRVEIQIQDPENAKKSGLKIGLSANVEIIVSQKENVLIIPSNTVIGKGVERSIYLLKPEGKFYRMKKTRIQSGLSNWEWTEVKSYPGSEEVKKGDLVVTSLNDQGVEDGALVAIEENQRK